MICGNTSDFFDHPLPEHFVSAHGASHHVWAPGPPLSQSCAAKDMKYECEAGYIWSILGKLGQSDSHLVTLCEMSFLVLNIRAVESESWSRSRKDFQPEESESQKILTTPTLGRPYAHQLWLFVPQTCVSVTLGNLSSLTLQQEMIMAIQTGGSALTCIPSLRGHSRSATSLGLITQLTLCECNRLGLVSLKFPFAHSGWHYRCSVTLASQ